MTPSPPGVVSLAPRRIRFPFSSSQLIVNLVSSHATREHKRLVVVCSLVHAVGRQEADERREQTGFIVALSQCCKHRLKEWSMDALCGEVQRQSLNTVGESRCGSQRVGTLLKLY